MMNQPPLGRQEHQDLQDLQEAPEDQDWGRLGRQEHQALQEAPEDQDRGRQEEEGHPNQVHHDPLPLALLVTTTRASIDPGVKDFWSRQSPDKAPPPARGPPPSPPKVGEVSDKMAGIKTRFRADRKEGSDQQATFFKGQYSNRDGSEGHQGGAR